MHPTVANAIVGHGSARPIENRYIKVSNEDLWKAVDSMSFDYGVKELDFGEESYEKDGNEKGAESIRKMSPMKKMVALLQQTPLDNVRSRSVL